MPDAFVAFDQVALAYTEKSGNAIEDISLDIRDGEFVAVVGPSGCGKTTFMKLCSGLRPPTGGTVTVLSRRVSGPLKIVGMAFQNPTLLPLADGTRQRAAPAGDRPAVPLKLS